MLIAGSSDHFLRELWFFASGDLLQININLTMADQVVSKLAPQLRRLGSFSTLGGYELNNYLAEGCHCDSCQS